MLFCTECQLILSRNDKPPADCPMCAMTAYKDRFCDDCYKRLRENKVLQPCDACTKIRIKAKVYPCKAMEPVRAVWIKLPAI